MSHVNHRAIVQLINPSLGGPDSTSIVLSVTRRIPTYCACTCSCHQNKQFQIPNYWCPGWLLSRMMSILFTYSRRDGPMWRIRMPRVRQNSSLIFQHMLRGDIKAIQSLFSQGLASPFDVNENGKPLLSVGTKCGDSMPRY